MRSRILKIDRIFILILLFFLLFKNFSYGYVFDNLEKFSIADSVNKYLKKEQKVDVDRLFYKFFLSSLYYDFYFCDSLINLDNFKEQVEKYKDNLACVILEVAATEEPQKEFLEGIREICTKENIVLIFDEVVSGFRFHPKGAQFLYGITPDLSTFGKAMANGYSISALVGKKEIMELGGLYHKKERVFLLSTTYGGETHHLRAAMKSIEILNRNDYEVTNYIWKVGKTIKEEFNKLSKQFNLYEKIRCEGVDCRPYFYCENGYLRLLFQQEMARYGVLVQSINPSFSHRDSEITQTIEAFEKSLKTLSYGIESNKIRELLIEDREIKPVFRKYN